MPVLGQFNEKAQTAIHLSTKSAYDMRQPFVGTENLLIGLLTVARDDLTLPDTVTVDNVTEAIRQISGIGSTIQQNIELSAHMKHLFQFVVITAARAGRNLITTLHLWHGLLNEKESTGYRILLSMGLDIPKAENELIEKIRSMSPVQQENASKFDINAYGRDLTETAKKGEFDPVIGRDQEIDRIIQILSRRTKNNPIIVGEPGTGKTAIAEALAQRIADGTVHDELKSKHIFALDVASMIAGTKFRGEFEERFKNFINEIIKDKNTILFIDEMQQIVGAGKAEGSVDAAGILKPVLARGIIRVIGACTNEDYRKSIEKDSALCRRFQPVQLHEPNHQETLQMLYGIRKKYEDHHHLTITDEALETAVTLSERYIQDRFEPDKAIDLLDEAASRVKLSQKTETPDSVGIIDPIAGKTYAAPQVTGEDIASVVAMWTGVPVEKLSQTESKRLMHLEDSLHKRLIGQEQAVSAVSRSIRRARAGLKNPEKPIGTFLFLGPTGVGKTELCRALADTVFGDTDALIRLDMSEYMEKHSVSRMVGSPPGYVGFEEGGQLTERVRKKPYAVVLFDEIEKAHPDVFNMLLQIMDDGRLTDNTGRTASFKNCIIVMTSNTGTQAIRNMPLGFGGRTDIVQNDEKIRQKLMAEVRNTFKPEFINRIDEMIIFNSLTKDDIRKIVALQLSQVCNRLSAQGITLHADDSVIDLITEKGYDPAFGARPVRRVIQTEIEDALSEEIISGHLSLGDSVSASASDNTVSFLKIPSFASVPQLLPI